MKLKDLGEFNLIERLSNRIKLSRSTIKGIGDDTAVLRYKKGKFLLFTTDMLVEDAHFKRKEPAYLVGRKSLSVNISDIAAMGGLPKYAVISLGVPPLLDVKYVDNLYKGIKDVAMEFGIDLVGGDTVSSNKIIINISLIGEVEEKNLVLRSGAKKGDYIFVTGEIGGSLKGKHLGFTPRLKEARFLVKNFKINSMIDVSDGLLADLAHILDLSRAGAVIYEKDIPLSKEAKDFNSAVRDGEDFELIFTTPKESGKKIIARWPFKTHISLIGGITGQGGKLYLIKKSGKKVIIKSLGYTHF